MGECRHSYRHRERAVSQQRGFLGGGGAPPTKRTRLISFAGYAGELSTTDIFSAICVDVNVAEVSAGIVTSAGNDIRALQTVAEIKEAALRFGVTLSDVVPGLLLEVGDDVPDWSRYEVLD